ncbi:MAG: EAL domain-containing protein (putative c-di-GMP-specific phosphodiesterase class I) [Bradymonadia bacterium]|jgi:EAL domain-containing protein (putative c-di-GMP-specific phosphodiesterase class I)
MARCFELEVAAEGVETREQLDLLASFGFRFFQGYYFREARPVLA